MPPAIETAEVRLTGQVGSHGTHVLIFLLQKGKLGRRAYLRLAGSGFTALEFCLIRFQVHK